MRTAGAMRVLHFCKRFSGLSETFIYEYIQALERSGVEDHVLTCIREHAAARPFERVDVVGWPSVWSPRRIHRRATGAMRGEPAENSFWMHIQPRLPSFLDRVRPDVVHAHFAPAAMAIMDAAVAANIPLVATFYGYDASGLGRDPFWRRRLDTLWQRASAVTVLSHVMRTDLLALGCPEDRLHVVRLGRDLRRLPFRAPHAPVRHIVSVGRLTEKKGHLDALAAFAILRKTHPARFTLIGDGELREPIIRFVSAHGLGDCVTLRGELPNDAVLHELAGADAFLLASKTAANGDQEGTPTVLVEAQALGLPCITTRHAGIPEMIPEANHRFLSAEGDVTGIATALQRVVTRSAAELREIASAGRAWVERDYDIDRNARALRHVYDRVTGAAGD